MSLKRILIGRPIKSVKERHERLTKMMGLAVFSSDALSSVAYGPEEIFLALIVGGTSMLHYSIPISLAILVLIAVVSVSYVQTIHAYPSGGGAYIVAKENLGIYPGLTAAAALLIDYVLTVTVSITAGIAAISSAFPLFYRHRVLLCIIAILIIMVINLRGVRESGRIFSIPVYLFITGIFLLIGIAVFKSFRDYPTMTGYTSSSSGILPTFLILKAFASGCATLTGIEAVSNGVRAFKPPESRNAGMTLLWMALLLGAMTLGITFFANSYHILPSRNETVLSQLARAVFSGGIFYYVVQFLTSFILILAANTSFADFPRLSSIMASDGYLPRQLSNRGDRLVFSNGILILGFLSALLVMIFGGDTHALIPLYAIGVFTAFTLSQAGMVKHWLSYKGRGWIKGILINSIGTVTTGIVLVVIAFEKFTQGAWIVLLAIPGIIALTRKIYRHYLSIVRQLSLEGSEERAAYKRHYVVIPISGINKASINAIRYARTLSEDINAVYISLDRERAEEIREKWKEDNIDVPLTILDSPYRSITEPLVEFIDGIRKVHKEGIVTVVLPEFVPQKWWHHLLHTQTALFIKGVLLFKKGVVSTSVPFKLKK